MTALVVIDRDDLQKIVRDAVADAMAQNPKQEWLSVPDYCARYSRSKSTVYRHIAAGTLQTKDVCGKTLILVD